MYSPRMKLLIGKTSVQAELISDSPGMVQGKLLRWTMLRQWLHMRTEFLARLGDVEGGWQLLSSLRNQGAHFLRQDQPAVRPLKQDMVGKHEG